MSDDVLASESSLVQVPEERHATPSRSSACHAEAITSEASAETTASESENAQKQDLHSMTPEMSTEASSVEAVTVSALQQEAKDNSEHLPVDKEVEEVEDGPSAAATDIATLEGDMDGDTSGAVEFGLESDALKPSPRGRAPGPWLLALFKDRRVGEVVLLPEPMELRGRVLTQAMVERDFRTASGALLLRFQPGNESYIIKFSDVKQEYAMMRSIHEMNQRWREHGVRVCEENVEAVTYDIVPLESEGGLVEAVPNCNTLRELRRDCKSDSRERVLLALGADEKKLNRLASATAAYLTAIYVLGVRDGHDDNIMLREDGSLFRVDFGFVFGATPEIDTPQTVIARSVTFALGEARWTEVVAACGDTLTALTGDSYGSPPGWDCLSSVPEMRPYHPAAEVHCRSLSLAGFCQDVACADQWSFARAAKNTLREAVQFLKEQAGLGPDDLKKQEQSDESAALDIPLEEPPAPKLIVETDNLLVGMDFTIEPGMGLVSYYEVASDAIDITAENEHQDNSGFTGWSLIDDLAEMAKEGLVVDGYGDENDSTEHEEPEQEEIFDQTARPVHQLHLKTSRAPARRSQVPFPSQPAYPIRQSILPAAMDNQLQGCQDPFFPSHTFYERDQQNLSHLQHKQQQSSQTLQMSRRQALYPGHVQRQREDQIHDPHRCFAFQPSTRQAMFPQPQEQHEQQTKQTFHIQHQEHQAQQRQLLQQQQLHTWDARGIHVQLQEWPNPKSYPAQHLSPLPAGDPFAKTPPSSPRESPQLLEVIASEQLQEPRFSPLPQQRVVAPARTHFQPQVSRQTNPEQRRQQFEHQQQVLLQHHRLLQREKARQVWPSQRF